MNPPRSESSIPHRRYRFGEFTLDVDRGALLCAGRETKLRPKSFEVLTYLVEHPGRLVTKDELLSAVWGDVVVTEDSLTQCLIDIRKVIGDASRQMIRTVPRRGYLFDLPVDAATASALEAPADTGTGPGRLRWAYGVAVVLLVGTAAVWWNAGNRVETSDPTVSQPALGANSIAVLPFADMSQAQDQAYFADGISEEILNLLAQSTALSVIARTSSFSFKGENADIVTIAEKLGVAHVLEGSVRKSGNRVRITAQLIDASTSTHLWSETYDRELGDILAVQTDIAASVADALEVRLAVEAPTPIEPVNPRAYSYFLQGRFFHNRRGPGDPERARRAYEQAVALDPDFARAWAGLAGAYLVLMGEGELALEAGRQRHREAVERALALGPDLAETHVRAAHYQNWFGDRGVAFEHLQKALSLDPNNPLALAAMGGYELDRGRFEEAIELQQRAADLDPLNYINRKNLATNLLAAGLMEQAKAEFVRAKELNPANAPNIDIELGFILILEEHFDEALAAIRQWPESENRDKGLALVYAALGRDSEGDVALDRLVAAPGIDADIRVAEVLAHRGAIDEAFRWLAQVRDEIRRDRRSIEAYQTLNQIWFSPFLQPLRKDPRWDSLFAEFPSQPWVTAGPHAR